MDVTLRQEEVVEASHRLLGDLPLRCERVMAGPCRGDPPTVQRAVEPGRAYSGGSHWRRAPVATLRHPVLLLLVLNTVESPDCPSRHLDLHRGRLALTLTPHQRTYNTTVCITKSDS